MLRYELADTVAALIESLEAPPESGIVITEADLEIPLEIHSGVRNGRLIFYGSVPHTRWKSGVLPEVHLGRLHVELVEVE